MIFVQLTEYVMKNIFVENPFTKCGGETIPRTFPKEIKIKYISR